MLWFVFFISFHGSHCNEFVRPFVCGWTAALCRNIRAAKALSSDTSTGGVKVDDFLRSSDPHIYAVGEVASHEGGGFPRFAGQSEGEVTIEWALQVEWPVWRATKPVHQRAVQAGEPLCIME